MGGDWGWAMAKLGAPVQVVSDFPALEPCAGRKSVAWALV